MLRASLLHLTLIRMRWIKDRVIAAVVMRQYAERALFAIAAAVLVLVLIGIHNAWDTVTYVAVSQPEKADRG